jgi:hypothetical protein
MFDLPFAQEEIFDIMNLLEDRLQHANSAVVLATTKVFLHLTMSMADVHQQVCLITSCDICCLLRFPHPFLRSNAGGH